MHAIDAFRQDHLRLSSLRQGREDKEEEGGKMMDTPRYKNALKYDQLHLIT